MSEIGFLNCDDIYMRIINHQFELIEFVFDSLSVDLQYDEISLTLLLGMCPYVVSVVMWSSGLSVRFFNMKNCIT